MRPGMTAVFAFIGALVVLSAGVLDARWFALHVALTWWPPLPLSLLPWIRGGLVVLGLGLAGAGWLLGRWIGRQPKRERWGALGRIALATVLALAAAELGLQLAGWGEAPWRAGRLELRLGKPDARCGWAPVPSRSTTVSSRGNVTRYAIDAWGDRAEDAHGAPDPARPSVVFAGESVTFGLGVPFEQTFPAVLGSALGLQVVNTAYPGYAADQALLRLEAVLPRLQQPKVVVVTFLPAMLMRDLQDFRPRLVLRDGALVPVPAATGLLARLRLRDLLRNELPYLSDARLEKSLELTSAILLKSAREARARHASPVFVVISLGPQRAFDAHPEAPLLRRLFVQQGLPFVLVDVEERELVPRLTHPNGPAHRRIAEAIEACVRRGACAPGP